MSILNVRHAGIVVSDMQRSLSFYKDLLGMTITVDTIERGDFISTITGLANAEVHIIKLAATNGTIIELLEYMQPRLKPTPYPVNAPGYSHVACAVPDVDSLYTMLLKNGITFKSEPMVSPDGFAKIVYALDPDGTIIELVEVLKP